MSSSSPERVKASPTIGFHGRERERWEVRSEETLSFCTEARFKREGIYKHLSLSWWRLVGSVTGHRYCKKGTDIFRCWFSLYAKVTVSLKETIGFVEFFLDLDFWGCVMVKWLCWGYSKRKNNAINMLIKYMNMNVFILLCLRCKCNPRNRVLVQTRHYSGYLWS